jgi:acyl-CoA reductase-like NAD-dependent aldehyde dehydrogenase
LTFAAPPPPVAPSSIAEIDAAIARLDAKKAAWTSASIADRVRLLDACAHGIARTAERWAAIGARVKGLEPTADLAGEEWLSGPWPALRNARLLANALRQGGAPRPTAVRTSESGHTVARIFPAETSDRLLFAGITADVWIARGKPASQGAIYRAPRPGEGRVCLVLGGGNVSSIPPMDVFTKLFVENEVVLLKMNPVNEAIGPILAEALEPLVSAGWLEIVYGGSEVGAHAATHPNVGSLHVTGSDRTYDAIVWGASEIDRKANKARGARINERPFSAELGCVTPVIVVPGPWSKNDIRFQARHVAGMVTQNASFNCNAAKVVVVARQWLQRRTFLAALHEELANTPPRKAYYPGARARYAEFLERYPAARVLGQGGDDEGVVPWTAIPGVAPNDAYALRHEAFCGLVSEVELDAPDYGGASVPRFLEQAVKLANESCWGTLSCCLLVHPQTAEDHAPELARAVADLRYGSIGINVWPGVIYGLASPTWGAFPGHPPEDIQSGSGVVHNTWLFDHPEKSVVRAPFRIRPTPPWFSDHRNLLELGRRLVAYEAAPSLGGLLRVVTAAMRG